MLFGLKINRQCIGFYSCIEFKENALLYGLRRIIQIDGFIAARQTVVELDGHSIINGTNGAGKSSTLKLLAFFYGSDPSQLDAHAAGRDPFVQFYLPRQTSLLIFEYSRESGLCCAVAYRHKSGSKHVYRFLAAGFTQERFSQKNAQGELVYCQGHELKMHWQRLKLDCSQQVEIVTDYRAIIQNDSALINRDSKLLRRLAGSYCLGSRTTHMRYIDRICSAIISRSANMERMKDMLADIMAGDGILFPDSPLHQDDPLLAKEISSLLEFEQEIPRMKQVLQRHYERLQIESELCAYGAQLKQAEKILSADIAQAKQKLALLENQLRQLEVAWESDFNQLNIACIKARNERESCQAKIKRLDQQYDHYDKQNMASQAADFDNLGRFMQEAENKRLRYKKLSEKVQEEENALNRSLNEEYERFERTKTAKQKQLDSEKDNRRTHEQEYAKQREAIIRQEQAEIEALRAQSGQERQALSEEKASAQAIVNNGGATTEERNSLREIEQLIEQRDYQIKKQDSKLQRQQSALNDLQGQRQNADACLKQAKNRRNKLKDELDYLHKLAFAEDGTWLKRLREKDPNWVQRLGKVINPELLQRKDLQAQFLNEELDSVFGWSINLNAIAPSMYTESEQQLRHEYTQQEQAISLADEKILEYETVCEKLHRNYKKVELEISKERLSLNKLMAQKEKAQSMWSEKNHDIDAAISVRRTRAKDEVERIEKQIVAFDKKLHQCITAIKSRYENEYSALQQAFNLELDRLENTIVKLEQDISEISENHRQQKRQLREDFSQACSAKGIDNKTIAKAQTAADLAQSKVEAIRQSASAVNLYREWLSSEWQKREPLTKALSELSAQYEGINQQISDQEKQFKQQKNQVNAEKSKQTTNLNKVHQRLDQINTLRSRLLPYMNNGEDSKSVLPFDILMNEVLAQLQANDKIQDKLISEVQWLNNKISQFEETQIGQAWQRAKDNLRQELGFDDAFDRKFLLNVPQALEIFIDEEVKSIRAAKLESLRGLGKGLTDFFQRLQVIHNQIKSQSRKISAAIAENMKIEALSSMAITLNSKIDSLDYWKSLQDFSSLWWQWRESDQYELPNQEFLDQMSALITTLQTIKSGKHLRNYFDLHIRMIENGHERIIKNDYQLDNSTSDGLKYLALCVIFIAISRLLCPDRNVKLHWPIDELGILHGENIARLFSMLNQGGIVMVGGFPSEDPVMLRHFKHRQVIDFQKGIRVIDIPKSTLRERALARQNKELVSEQND